MKVADAKEEMAGVNRGARKTRVAWVDFARVLGIFLVCNVHSTAAPGNVFLSQAAVAMFFLIFGYFNSGAGVGKVLKRMLLLAAAYSFWSVLCGVLSHEGVALAPGAMWRSVVYAPFPMWFIKYTILLLPLGFFLTRLPTWAKLLLAAGLLCATYTLEPVCEYVLLTWERPGVVQYPTYVVFLYMLGDLLRRFPLERLPGVLFPGMRRCPRASMAATWTVFAALAAAVYVLPVFPQREMLYLVGIWLLLACAYTAELVMPRVAGIVAGAGASVILVYLCNPLYLKVCASAHLHVFGSLPHPLLSVVLCVLLVCGCAVFYNALVGKNRVLDAILFGR